MNCIPRGCRTLRLGCTLAVLAGVAVVQAQTPRSVRPATQPAAPALAPGTVGSGVPSPSGLASPLPNPAGLTSQFPAGLPSPLPNPAGLPSPTVPNLASPGTPAGSPPIDEGIATPPTNAMGAAGYGGGAARGQPQPVVQSGPYTALQTAQSFLGADANHDGELTRAEALHLSIMPFSFEDMDLNHDGVITRSEYEESLR